MGEKGRVAGGGGGGGGGEGGGGRGGGGGGGGGDRKEEGGGGPTIRIHKGSIYMGPRGRMHVQACLCTLGAGTGGAVLWRPRLRNGCSWWGPHNLPHFSRMPGGIDVRPDLWPGPRTPAKVQSPGSSQRSCPKSMPPGRRKIEVYWAAPTGPQIYFSG